MRIAWAPGIPRESKGFEKPPMGISGEMASWGAQESLPAAQAPSGMVADESQASLWNKAQTKQAHADFFEESSKCILLLLHSPP